jgi:hypothetical protein
MKKVMGIVLAVFLVVGLAGPAMAAFELGNVELVAYENTDQAIPISNLGKETHYDLGATTSSFVDLSIGAFSVDTGITLGDYNATAWDQIYVGLFGGGKFPNFQPQDIVFASGTDTFSIPGPAAFGSGMGLIWQGNQANPANRDKNTTNSYWDVMDLDGNSPSYAGFLGGFSGSDFGPEVQLGVDPVTMGMYTTGSDGSGLTKIGTWTLSTDTTSLVASYNPVPVPGAVLLFGTGLLGFFGIRRRKQ